MAQTIILAPLQIASAVGEMVAQFVILGHRGLALAITRKFSAQGRAILKTHKHFTGNSVRDKISNPGNDIGDKISTVIWAILHWTRTHVRQNLLLGNMTKEEFATGKINFERLAKIGLTAGAGRWAGWSGGVKVVIFLIAVGFTGISSGKHGFALSALGVLALTIAPLARLQVDLHEDQDAFSTGSGSILFKQYVGFFRLCSAIFGIALMVALYYYFGENGFGRTVSYFFIASIIQGPIYALLKFMLTGEILLIPLEIIGLALLYFIVVL